MAIITLSPRGTLIGARRLLSRSGYCLTVRSGRICTKRLTPQTDPRTPAQLSARRLFAEANALAVRALKDPVRKAHWQREAARLGYRTPIGAARAYFVALLRSRAASVRPDPRRPAVQPVWRLARIPAPRRASFPHINSHARLQVSTQTANFACHINWITHGLDPDRRRPPSADKV